MTCVSLPVGTLRSHRLWSPSLSTTLSTNLASGEMAVEPSRPELWTCVLVTCVMVKFWYGRSRV